MVAGTRTLTFRTLQNYDDVITLHMDRGVVAAVGGYERNGEQEEIVLLALRLPSSAQPGYVRYRVRRGEILLAQHVADLLPQE